MKRWRGGQQKWKWVEKIRMTEISAPTPYHQCPLFVNPYKTWVSGKKGGGGSKNIMNEKIKNKTTKKKGIERVFSYFFPYTEKLLPLPPLEVKISKESYEIRLSGGWWQFVQGRRQLGWLKLTLNNPHSVHQGKS